MEELKFSMVAVMVLGFVFVPAHIVDNTGQFSLLLNCTYTGSGPFLLHIPPSWLGQEAGAGTRLLPLTPADQVDTPYHMRTSSVIKSCRKKTEWKIFRVMDIQNNGICLPRWLLSMVQACFRWDDWAPVCPWEAVSEFLGLLCLQAQLLLLFWLFSPCPWVKVSEWLWGAQLFVGVLEMLLISFSTQCEK